MLGSGAPRGLPARGAALDPAWQPRLRGPAPHRKVGPMSQLLTTAAVEPSRQLAYWTEMVCDTYVQLDCAAAADTRTIEGEIAVDQLATLQLSRVTATAQKVHSTTASIAW